MKVLRANIEDVMREAIARWTLITYFVLSTIFILMFASAVNLDIVDGSLAGARLFGNDVHMNQTFSVEKLVLGFESFFSCVIYILGLVLAIFATAHLVPRLQEKGTVDLYLSRPVSRVGMLLSRYCAGLLLTGINVAYLLGSLWLIVIVKTHLVHPRFLLAGVLMMFVIAVMLAFAFLIGVVTSSTAVSIMATVALALMSTILFFHDRFEAAVSAEWKAYLIKAFYWTVPKTVEIGAAVIAFVAQHTLPNELQPAFSWAPFVSTGVFGIVCLALASWLFQRKEF